MKAICISASNILQSKDQSISLQICKRISEILNESHILCEIIDLRKITLFPCIGCGKCFDNRRCCNDEGFNEIYDKLAQSNIVFFISPHYAPIPAKLSMLLEKMEEITFLHWWKDNTYKSELYALPAGIISHGGGADWALKSYKAMVNDTIANALDTIQFKIIPYDTEWDTGISLPVYKVLEQESIFPIQEYDRKNINQKLNEYVKMCIQVLDVDR